MTRRGILSFFGGGGVGVKKFEKKREVKAAKENSGKIKAGGLARLRDADGGKSA